MVINLLLLLLLGDSNLKLFSLAETGMAWQVLLLGRKCKEGKVPRLHLQLSSAV